MRKLIFVVLLLSLLIGCNIDENSNSSKIEKEQPIQKDRNEVTPSPRKSMNDYAPNPQVTDDRTLLSAGETFRDEKGAAKLLAYTKLDKGLTAGPIEMVLKEAKIIDYTPDYSLIDFYHSYTHEEHFTFLKIFVEIENKSNEILNFAPVSHIQSDTGEEKTWAEDIYLEELNGAIRPGEKKAGNIGFIVENSDINSIQVTTSKVLNQDEKETFEEQTVDFKF
ncbi:MAG: DUF4352 domain-containing protein [Mesobacillus sp.]